MVPAGAIPPGAASTHRAVDTHRRGVLAEGLGRHVHDIVDVSGESRVPPALVVHEPMEETPGGRGAPCLTGSMSALWDTFAGCADETAPTRRVPAATPRSISVDRAVRRQHDGLVVEPVPWCHLDEVEHGWAVSRVPGMGCRQWLSGWQRQILHT
jgi:hypothetical protein